jgi:hypothetical protein
MLALPADEDLIDELANVRLRETSPGVVRMDHGEGQHDDRAIALALAASKLLERPLSFGSASFGIAYALASSVGSFDTPGYDAVL